eukprot:SAG31_NODE_3138_length_4632_cov_2.290315_4_plen_825_part_00
MPVPMKNDVCGRVNDTVFPPPPAPAPPAPPTPPVPPAPPPDQLRRDLATVRQRMFDFKLKYGECTQNSNCVEQYKCASACMDAEVSARTIDANGKWADVNYTSKNNAKWDSFTHVQRVLFMVRSFHCTSCATLYADTATLEKVHRGLSWWLNQNPTPPQWWWRDIGLPDAIGSIMILLGADATEDQLTKAVAMMRGAGLPTHGTGENVLWEQQVAFTRAVLSNDTASAWEVVYFTWLDVQVVTGQNAEGVMLDGSFHFHGNILYSGGYGSDFAINLVAFASLTAGTSFGITASAMEVLSMYLLDGQQWMMHAAGDLHGNGTYYDLSTKGREISRPPYGELQFAGPVVASSITGMLRPDTNRSDELKAFAARLTAAPTATPLVGAQHFWKSDYTAYHANAFFVSLKMFSKRMSNNEVCNGENLKADHTASGVLLTYQSGQEYLGIFPVWDWSRLPGTTTRAGVLGPEVRHEGSTDFVGGVVDGRVALSVMDYRSANYGSADPGGISAHKAHFFLPNGVLSLVQNVTLSTGGLNKTAVDIVTTIQQCILRGGSGAPPIGGASVTVGDKHSSSVVGDGKHAIPNNGSWIHHGGVVYFPVALPQDSGARESASWSLELGERSGSWHSINAGLDPSVELDNETIRLPIFLLQASHGAAPNQASLGYATVPAVLTPASARLAVDTFRQSTTVLRNDEAAQAVLDVTPQGETTLMVAAWPTTASQAVVVDGHWRVTINSPGLLIIKATKTASFTFAVADPTNTNNGTTMMFTIDKRLADLQRRSYHGAETPGLASVRCEAAGASATIVTIVLPTGDRAGSTARGSCRKDNM